MTDPAPGRTGARSCRRAGRGRRAALLTLALLALVSFSAACGGDKSGGPPSSGPDDLADLGAVADLTGTPEVQIEVPDNSYAPKAFKVSPGTKIVFRNIGANSHNVTPNDEGAFAVLTLKPDESATLIAPTRPGAYRFSCTLHGGQRGGFLVAGP